MRVLGNEHTARSVRHALFWCGLLAQLVAIVLGVVINNDVAAFVSLPGLAMLAAVAYLRWWVRERELWLTVTMLGLVMLATGLVVLCLSIAWGIPVVGVGVIVGGVGAWRLEDSTPLR
jgi:hypothetical protein